MLRRLQPYIYQRKNWPTFTWDLEALLPLLGKVRHVQGKLTGKMESLGFRTRAEATLETVTSDVLKSSEIEGELLNPDQVRSSIARHLGMEISGLVPSDRHVDGVVDMMLNATQQYAQPLTVDRLFHWHATLFPTGTSGQYKINTGRWRDDATGPMQVISGALGKEKIHFQAPDAPVIDQEMTRFIDWFNTEELLDPVIKAAVAHLWFVTIHPFDDGNGRIARAITDMQLARADESTQRFYSMSSQIRIERNAYYDTLEKTQQGDLDITKWLQWFLQCLMSALQATTSTLSNVMQKAHYWEQHRQAVLNDRQRFMLNKLWDDFDGKLTSSKWAKMSKCSPDTALRDIQDLIHKNMLRKETAGGRSTNYELTISDE
ncbi:MAG: Fic family protein [Cytophagaceae bacterium]|jgi:Fic family protein|nr:Fic family protein [Cytophagaceae bacterium]